MSGGRSVDALQSTVVRVVTSDGVEGWAETCPLGPTYLAGHAAGALAALRTLAPALVGVDARNLAAVNRTLDSALVGHAYAKSALDIACWDILGRSLGAPVCDLLGGRVAERFPLYRAVPLATPDEMAAYVAARRAEGIHRFQLKLGGDPRADAGRTRRVLEATEPDELVVADANGGWRLADAAVAARLLETLDGVFLEQPCPTLAECVAVRRRTTLPMILDEVIVDTRSLLAAHRAGAMEAINLKLGKVGGLTKARLIRDLAQELGLRLTIEDTWGGDLTTAAVSHLAASTAPESLFTVSFMNDWTREHVAGYDPRSSGGWGSAPASPGLGVDVDRSALGAAVFVACR
jgi:cis-L-3-hydroxyproline dehydratase